MAFSRYVYLLSAPNNPQANWTNSLPLNPNPSTLIGIPHVYLSILGSILPLIKTPDQNLYSFQKSHDPFLQSHHSSDLTSTLQKPSNPTFQNKSPTKPRAKLQNRISKLTVYLVTLFPVCVLSSFAYESSPQNQPNLQNSKPLGKTSPKPPFLRKP